MNVDDSDYIAKVRQVNLSSLNCAVNLLSTDDQDTIEGLSRLGVDLLKQVKKLDNDK